MISVFFTCTDLNLALACLLISGLALAKVVERLLRLGNQGSTLLQECLISLMEASLKSLEEQGEEEEDDEEGEDADSANEDAEDDDDDDEVCL